MKLFSRHRLPTTFTIDDIIWVSSEKEACSLIFSYVEVHWLKLAPGLNEVTGGKTTPQNIFFGPILPNFEENFEIGIGDFERCSMLPVRKTTTCIKQIQIHAIDKYKYILYKYNVEIQMGNEGVAQ